MKTYDKTLQQKTIELTPEELKKAVLYYLEDAKYTYSRSFKDDNPEEKTDGMIIIGKNTELKINEDMSATVITYYG